jgi:hypothetical protein
MLPFGVTIPATVPQGSEIPEGLMNNPVYIVLYVYIQDDSVLMDIIAGNYFVAVCDKKISHKHVSDFEWLC